MGITQAQADKAIADFTVEINGMVDSPTPPPPGPAGTSPDGTRLTATTTQIIDASGNIWKADRPVNVTFGIMLSTDGGKTFNRVGTADILAWCGGKILVTAGPTVFYWNGTWFPVFNGPLCPQTN